MNVQRLSIFFAQIVSVIKQKATSLKALHRWRSQYLAVALTLGVALIIFTAIALSGSGDPVILLVDDEPLVLVESEKSAEKALELAVKQLTQETGSKVTGFTNHLSYQAPEVEGVQNLEQEDSLILLLKEKLDWQVQGVAITVNGNPVVYVSSSEAANEVLERIKQRYLEQEDGDITLEKVAFAEEIQIVPGEGPLKSFKRSDEAVEFLAQGTEKLATYTIKSGDSLWTIAHSHEIDIESLQEANPQLKGELLKIGQELNLKKKEPLLTVVYSLVTSVEEQIAYQTVYESDASLFTSQQKVKKEGVYGSQEATYRITKANGLELERETLLQKVLTEPVARVVIRGTKTMVASRSAGEGSRLEWPIRGPITSGYGPRGSSFHTGIDIDGNTGDSISAAAGGVVTFKGWSGNYGNLIAIDHGEGMVTRYAHLSRFKINVGDTVTVGQLIGLMGSTGRSTGSHLHFEVWINGASKNPIAYLNR